MLLAIWKPILLVWRRSRSAVDQDARMTEVCPEVVISSVSTPIRVVGFYELSVGPYHG
jgi:hypothetical protein